MSRPSRNQDQLLIETAKRLLPRTGVSGMSLKLVADEAGVNLGMFNYHFGSKKKFVQKVLASLLKEILDEVEEKSLKRGTSIERLRQTLLALGCHIRNHRKLFASMIQDVLNRDKEVSDFIRAFMGRQLDILIPLIEEAQADGSIEALSLRQCLAFAMASINMPTLISEAITRMKMKNEKVSLLLKSEATTDEAIEQRVNMAIKALSTRPKKVL